MERQGVVAGLGYTLKRGESMNKNEVIYIVKPTWYTEDMYPGHRQFYVKFVAQLKEYHEVRELELPDVWVRDFLPVQNLQTGELYQPFFDPRYANYTPKFTDAIRMLVRGAFPHAKLCDVRIDGENMVVSPDRNTPFAWKNERFFTKRKPIKSPIRKTS